jgi:hypothetical protein
LASNNQLSASIANAHLAAPPPSSNPDKAGDFLFPSLDGLHLFPDSSASTSAAKPAPPIVAAVVDPVAMATEKPLYELELPPPPPPVDGAPPDFPTALVRELQTAPAFVPPKLEFSASDIDLQFASPPVDSPGGRLRVVSPRTAATAAPAATSVASPRAAVVSPRTVSSPRIITSTAAPATVAPVATNTPASVDKLDRASHSVQRSAPIVSPRVRGQTRSTSTPDFSEPQAQTTSPRQQYRRQGIRLDAPPKSVVQADSDASDIDSVASSPASSGSGLFGDKTCHGCKKRKYAARVTQSDNTQQLLCKLCVAEVQRIQPALRDPTAESADALVVDWCSAASGRYRAKRQVDRDAPLSKRQASCGIARHTLEAARLSHPAWCHVCHSLLWLPDGLDVARCAAAKCAFAAHLQCVGAASETAPLSVAAMSCPTSAGAAYDGYSGPVFGVTLAEACSGRRNVLPMVVQDTVLYLLAHCSNEEGLLRHSGSHAQMQQMARSYATGVGPQLAGCDPHTVAGLLKLFFRELSDRLVPSALDDQVCERLAQAKSRGESTQSVALYLRDTLIKLPRPNYELCKFMTFFFVALEQHESENKMSMSNILVCIAPTLQCTVGIFMHAMRNYEVVFGTPQNVTQAQTVGKFATFDAIKH